MTTHRKDRSASASLIPIIVCPECGILEPAGYVGGSTGDVVAAGRSHFMDKAGFLYCGNCGAVWNTTYKLPAGSDIDADALPPTIFALDIVGTGQGFRARDADDFGLFRRLGRLHARTTATKATNGQRRINDRIYDAEALCALLDLPPATKAAITFHIKAISERADLGALLPRLRLDGAVRSVRGEAVTIATVALVMERHGIQRGAAIDRMIAAFRFTRGPATITADEFDAAHRACADWFGAHLWRDGPEDEGRAA